MLVQLPHHKTLDVCNDIFLLVAPICVDILSTWTQWNPNKTAALVKQTCGYNLYKSSWANCDGRPYVFQLLHMRTLTVCSA